MTEIRKSSCLQEMRGMFQKKRNCPYDLENVKSYKTPEDYNASGVFLSFFEIKLFWPDYLLSGERFPDR